MPALDTPNYGILSTIQQPDFIGKAIDEYNIVKAQNAQQQQQQFKNALDVLTLQTKQKTNEIREKALSQTNKTIGEKSQDAYEASLAADPIDPATGYKLVSARTLHLFNSTRAYEKEPGLISIPSASDMGTLTSGDADQSSSAIPSQGALTSDNQSQGTLASSTQAQTPVASGMQSQGALASGTPAQTSIASGMPSQGVLGSAVTPSTTQAETSVPNISLNNTPTTIKPLKTKQDINEETTQRLMELSKNQDAMQKTHGILQKAMASNLSKEIEGVDAEAKAATDMGIPLYTQLSNALNDTNLINPVTGTISWTTAAGQNVRRLLLQAQGDYLKQFHFGRMTQYEFNLLRQAVGGATTYPAVLREIINNHMEQSQDAIKKQSFYNDYVNNGGISSLEAGQKWNDQQSKKYLDKQFPLPGTNQTYSYQDLIDTANKYNKMYNLNETPEDVKLKILSDSEAKKQQKEESFGG